MLSMLLLVIRKLSTHCTESDDLRFSIHSLQIHVSYSRLAQQLVANSASLSTQLKRGLINIQLFASIVFRYGHHVSKNSYYICHDQQVIKSLFERIRNFDGAPNTVSMIRLLESALLDVLVMSDIRLWTQDRHI